MKKSKRKAETRKRAYEYAKSGNYNNWLAIERQIRRDGFPDARTVLDDHFIRQELNSLCAIATSPEETSRRRDFKQWIEQIDKELEQRLKEKMLKINITPNRDVLLVAGPNYLLEIKRIFDSKKLQYAKEFDSKGGERFRVGFDQISLDKDFDEMTMEDVSDLILQLKGKVESMAAYM